MLLVDLLIFWLNASSTSNVESLGLSCQLVHLCHLPSWMSYIVKKGPFRTTKFGCLLRVRLVPRSRTPFERKGARPHNTLALVIGHCLPRCIPYLQAIFKHITRLPNDNVQLYLESESGGSLMVGVVGLSRIHDSNLFLCVE